MSDYPRPCSPKAIVCRRIPSQSNCLHCGHNPAESQRRHELLSQSGLSLCENGSFSLKLPCKSKKPVSAAERP